tara:strand:- start:7453 stop:8091 length:639 start_codon:yes stop_codon:yes gene_type:complete
MENIMETNIASTKSLNKAQLVDENAKLRAQLTALGNQVASTQKYTNVRSVTFQRNEVVQPSVPEALEQLRELNAIAQMAQLVEEWKSAMVSITDRNGYKRNVRRVSHYQEIDVLETEAELQHRLDVAVASRNPEDPGYEKDAAPGQGIGTSHKIFHTSESLDKFKPEDKYKGGKAMATFGTNVQQIPHEEHEELLVRNPESKKMRMQVREVA